MIRKYKLKKPLTLSCKNFTVFMYESNHGYKDISRVGSSFMEKAAAELLDKYAIDIINQPMITITPEMKIIFKTIRDEEERINDNVLCLVIGNIGKQEYWSTSKAMHAYFAVFYYALHINAFCGNDKNTLTFKTKEQKQTFLDEYFIEM